MSDDHGTYTALRERPRQDLASLVPLPVPFTMYIEPTNVCNFKCSYCPVHFDDYAERSGGLGKLSLESCVKIFGEILTLGRLKTLNFYMLGEPFANRQLPDFIALARSMGVAERIIVTTNATLIDEAMATRTIESGLDYLRVSVYGSSTAQHQRVTGSKIPLERIVENVARLKRLRDARGARAPFIYAKMIDTKDPDDNTLFLDTFSPIVDQAAIEPAMNWNLPAAEGDLSGMGDALLGDAYFKHRKTACPFPFYTLVVNADLRVTVCCVDWEKTTAVGNLNRQTLREIWSGAALRDFQVKHLNGQRHTLDACRSCTYLHTAPDNMDGLSPVTFLARTLRLAEPKLPVAQAAHPLSGQG